MTVCSTDVPAGDETTSQVPQHFYAIIQSKSASCSMHRKDSAEIAATTILLPFPKSENPDYAEGNFLYWEPVFGAANDSLRAQAASRHCSPAQPRLLNREIKVNRILPPRDPVLPGKSYSLQR